MPSTAHSHPPRRRSVVIALTSAPLVALLAACGGSSNAADGGPGLALTAALPHAVPKGTTLVVGDPQVEQALRLSGELEKFTFPVTFANISGGPQTLEAFRAKALDLGSVADIPPLQAEWTGVDTRIVAAQFRLQPEAHPLYQLGVAPGVAVRTIADLRGKKIAYSPGQAQGALVLRVLQKAGLTQDDVELVELPSTGDVYPTALASKQIDVAPIGGVAVKRYLAKYGRDGATVIPHGLRDDPGHLYALESSLQDAGKAAAIREYVAHWGVALKWIDEHPKEWIEGYYVKNQGLTTADGEYLVKTAGIRDVPTDWTDAITRHQATADLLATEQDRPHIDVTTIWDRRFEKVGGTAYRTGKAS
ncbi:ABC transporter substrate-binding protein [Terrabacter sp. MAHUQ-38]|uniref:ABC transporter substrate-binding protein n=1 Tax=unclassified Terrabacter TaxID=2630222 RepID=UPI00165D59E9|nr:ABC transporter substrate-binding protein [Terrabacter sp. MAHUQ-38]MBC9824163.1 ABC transporter substrate-binding protein [Terrabacter sp. MAHUQ-38]